MNISDSNRTAGWNVGGTSDIKLSASDYFNMVMNLKTPRFSPEGMIKMKNMNSATWSAVSALMFTALPVSYGLTQLVWGPIRRSHSGMRFFGPIFAFVYPMIAFKMGRVPVPKRVYTDLLCDEGQDGTYLRSTLRQEQPGLWSFISKQMYDLGYQFEEINELRTNTEFTRTFVTL